MATIDDVNNARPTLRFAMSRRIEFGQVDGRPHVHVDDVELTAKISVYEPSRLCRCRR